MNTIGARHIKTIGALGAVLLATVAQLAEASETIAYSYDAKGRLVKVVHSGTINNNVTASYTHDKADNRRNLKITGAP